MKSVQAAKLLALNFVIALAAGAVTTYLYDRTVDWGLVLVLAIAISLANFFTAWWRERRDQTGGR